ncbi:uncharacterized protein IL334_005476 [Kwoniella shivajii]|uniref:WW domain-containing protein n=1 Tax=Kwoniella shivajii TaxID=564305 RepID=A0ABZ1D394_9TREE|nr:hypothetical protein IL334_005476 [Kwoniella shivajii]
MSTKKATVEDASSLSPSPSAPAPVQSSSPDGKEDTVDEPITTLGGDDAEAEGKEAEDEEEEEEEEEVWDPSSEKLPGQGESSKGKSKAKNVGEGEEQPWQAVWSPEQNAWYFWNTKSGQVSWTNPLEPSSSTSTMTPQPPLPSGPAPASSSAPTPAAGGYNAFEHDRDYDSSVPEIDPGLAHLFGESSTGGGMGRGLDSTLQKAKFNSRTGKFTGNEYQYTVGHLDEYNRAKRMNNHYFDVDAWEKQKFEENQKRKRDEEQGITDKKITKKDMDRFRKKAQEKKARSQAWLRE